MSVPESVSQRFLWMYFIAACVVVSIHCGIEMPNASSSEKLYLLYCTKWAVPFFFLMSGVFFGAHYKNDFESFVLTCKKKMKALILPYALWCVVGFAFRYPLIGESVGPVRLTTLIDGDFGLTCQFPIGNGVLWFLRALIVIQGLSLIGLGLLSKDGRLRRFCCVVATLLVLLLVVLRPGVKFLKELVGTPSSAVYFILGYVLSSILLRTYSRKISLWVIGTASVFLGASVILGNGMEALYRHFSNIAIILILACSIDLLLVRFRFRAVGFVKYTFFMYCAHRVPVEYIGRCMKSMGMGNSGLSYVGFCVIGISLACIMANVIERLCPRAYCLLNGGRK